MRYAVIGVVAIPFRSGDNQTLWYWIKFQISPEELSQSPLEAGTIKRFPTPRVWRQKMWLSQSPLEAGTIKRAPLEYV